MARAFELNPGDEEACRQVGRAYARMNQPDKEKEVYVAAARRWPHGWRPCWWLASWHFHQGHVEEAIHAYRDMVLHAPLLYRGYSNLGGLLVLGGRYDAAIDTLRRSIELRPSKEAFDNLGTAYFNSRRPQEAIDAYNQAFQFGFEDYRSWINLGDAHAWLRGDHDQAKTAYEEGIRRAREELQSRAAEGSARNVTTPASLASVFAMLAKPDSARVYLAIALRADSTNPTVAYSAALTHWQLGEKQQALRWLRNSVQAGFPTVWLRDSPIFDSWRGLSEFRALVAAEPSRPAAVAAHP
jgi:tetratricopeptide (TPR) repeat protein